MMEDSKQQLKLVVVSKPNSGCDYHRLVVPFSDFPEGIDFRIVKVGEEFDESVFDCDIVLFNRTFSNDIDKLMTLKRKYGFKVVVDLDDYWELPVTHYLYSVWKEYKTSENIINHLKYANAVFVSTEYLANKMINLFPDKKKSIFIVPNGINFNIKQFSFGKRPKLGSGDIIKFCYAAAPSHKPDLKSIENLFRRVGSDGEWRTFGHFTLGGYENHEIFLSMVKMIKPAENVLVTPAISIYNYMDFYRGQHVAIAPLVDNTFNRGKSNLKFLEAGAARMPFICSEVYPYMYDYCIRNMGIKFCSSVNEWWKSFMFFIKNPSAIGEFGEYNYEYVKEQYNMKNINDLRLDIFKWLKK